MCLCTCVHRGHGSVSGAVPQNLSTFLETGCLAETWGCQLGKPQRSCICHTWLPPKGAWKAGALPSKLSSHPWPGTLALSQLGSQMHITKSLSKCVLLARRWISESRLLPSWNAECSSSDSLREPCARFPPGSKCFSRLDCGARDEMIVAFCLLPREIVIHRTYVTLPM